MLEVLLDGRAHTIGSLARAAGIAPPTATEHVSRLEQGGLVTTRREGRSRLVSLAGPEVAASYEALAELAGSAEVHGLRRWTRHAELRAARTCYDHLAGRLGVAIADAALAAGAFGADFSLAAPAVPWLALFGVELDTLRGGRRPLLRVCTDWTERRPHLAGTLGAALCSAVLDAGWAVRRPGSRALRVTVRGQQELGRIGIADEALAGRAEHEPSAEVLVGTGNGPGRARSTL